MALNRTQHHHRLTRLGTTGAVVGALTAMPALPVQASYGLPTLRLIAASNEITLEKYGDWVIPDFGLYIAAEDSSFEVHVSRSSYGDPIVAKQVIRRGSGKTTIRQLPAGVVKRFSGFSDLFQITFTDSHGRKVVDRSLTFCPNGFELARIRQKAAPVSPYPVFCSLNPFTLGGVWGIQQGWAVNSLTRTDDPPINLPDGKYTAKISVTKRYRELFRIRGGQKTLKIAVRTVTDHQKAPRNRHSRVAKHGKRPPAGASQMTAAAPKPDLHALPAFDIELRRAAAVAGSPARDHLVFASTVWNSGPGVMVVDGFRRHNRALMDAYQYFYNTKGKQVGYTRAGSFDWDSRPGHEHWHFTDFVSYSLLDARRAQVVRGHKESFCLANTDAIDYTVKNARWKPDNTNLTTSCGRPTSLSIRQVLEVGSGDTYGNVLPGQSFDVTNLPNGTYFIKLTANPSRRLTEANRDNNTSFRTIILGGRPGKRTLKVQPHGLIDTF